MAHVDYQTKNCIVCGRPAYLHTGHVKDRNEHIIAGFCSHDCMYSIEEIDGTGYFGDYRESYGKELFKL